MAGVSGESEEEDTGGQGKLHWVPLVEAATPAAVAALTDSLHQAGIRFIVGQVAPYATLQPHSIGLVEMQLGERVMVPQETVERARKVLDEVRREAMARAVKDAFDPESLQERLSDPKADPVLKEMVTLTGLPPGERHESLSGRVADWLTEQVGEVKIAQSLAAAGLSEDDALRLVAEVVRWRADLFERSRARFLGAGKIILVTGLLLLLLGICVLILQAQSTSAVPITGRAALLPFLGFVGICTGYGMMARAHRMRNPAQRPDAN